MSESASDPKNGNGIGLAQTMVSDVAGASPMAVLPTGGASFPAAHWDKYEFLELLGRGGMGAVYKARDRRLGRVVALKFISGDDPAMVQRFMQEARAQARLEHRNICKVYDVGSVDNKPYIAMEIVAGQTLDKALRGLPVNDKLRIMRDAALAIHAAHEQGVIHRDLKPSNILVERGGDGAYRAVIMDFGLARDSGQAATHGLTESGAVMGTPAYMSPEQARGDAKRLDRRSDVYSLGATLYDVLSGKPPFDDQTVVNILLKVVNEAPRPLRSLDATLPEAVELIVSKCLNKEPEQRYPTARALAEDLERYLGAQRIVARRLSYSYRFIYWARRNRALAALAAGLLLSLLAFLVFSVRTRIVAIKREERAKKEAALAQTLGQSVEGLEWLVRTSYLLPLHDTSYEKGLVRERMAAITAELQGAGESGARLGAYVLGRGHLALHEWDAARAQLDRAVKLGHQDAELDYALGRVMGEQYARALEDARRSGDASFRERRKAELRSEFLAPALAHLQNSRHLKTVSSSYVTALIDHYEGRHDAALLNAYLARRQAPWLYEAAKLEGDVHLVRALELRDRGERDQAEQSFASALKRYEEAAAIGHSDPQLHDAMAEAWLRWEETDMLRGRDPEAKMQQALAAADRALEAAPRESYGYTKKAFAYYFLAQFAHNSGQFQVASDAYKKQINSAHLAIEARPQDAYAHDICGLAYMRLAEIEAISRRTPQALLKEAYSLFESAIRLKPRFPWAYNDFAISLLAEALDRSRHNQDPLAATDKALQLAEEATAADPAYLFAYNTKLASVLIKIRWCAERGTIPDLLLDSVRQIETDISRLTKINAPASGNIGSIYYYITIFNHDQGVSSQSSAALSLVNFNTLLSASPNIIDAYAYKSMLYAQLAAQAIVLNGSPDAEVRAGLEAVMSCYKIALRFPDCQGAEGLLHAAQAAWEQRQGRPFLALLQQAQELAKQATQQNPDSEELQLPLAQISRQLATALATALAQTSKRPLAVVAEGIAAADHALKISAGWPRALAEKGALLLLRSKLQQDPAQRRAALAAAQESFVQAFAGNPLLKRKYAEQAAEAERLGKQD